MQVNIEKTFSIDAPTGSSWQVLSDIRQVAACMPGAEITEEVDHSHYKGKVKAKIGPATMAFGGTVEILGIDPEKRELRLTSKGQDTKGTSSAQMDLTAWVLDGESGGSALKGEATVTVNGKVASLGGRMLTQVADQILNQFGKNFVAKAAAVPTEAGAAEAGAAAGGQAADATAGQTEDAQAINGLAFAWSVIVGFVKSLFGKKHANAG
jgi:carbon monoxide dehydrogenase subunit G